MRTVFTTLQGWFDRNRRETAVLLAICMLLSLPWFIGRNETVGAAAAARDLPIYNVKRDDKCVSLTFDAAWGDARVRRTSGRCAAHCFLLLILGGPRGMCV